MRRESTLESAKNWSAYDRDQFLKGTLRVEQAAMGYSPLPKNVVDMELKTLATIKVQ